MRTTLFALATGLLLSASPVAIAQTPTAPPPAKTPSGEIMWYSHQTQDTRASKLIGTKVVNANNETIGDINEVVLGKNGRVAAVIIGVGGFLGMGERQVAVSFEFAADSARSERRSDHCRERHQGLAEKRPAMALGHDPEQDVSRMCKDGAGLRTGPLLLLENTREHSCMDHRRYHCRLAG